jgi:FMN phosphatase YigB (HAD superfamily)
MGWIEASGFFDPAWYGATYPDVEGPESGRFTHYLEQGFRQGKVPGPLFDGVRYLEENPDVSRAGVNPLVHFLRSSPSEQRTAWTTMVADAHGRENLSIELHPTIEHPPRVAVMVHAYYAETFDVICRSLRSLPFPFTLLVSVPTPEARETVTASVRRVHLPVDLDVRVCPNRGRNFGPLVSEFADKIAASEYVLHLHTKRSLYTGGDQSAWRDELVQSLAGTRAVVMSIIQLFSTRPDVGLVYPTTTTSLSYWAHHWLSNTSHAGGLFSRLGVDDYPTEGYFPYPVGGMFWARVEAIRPLLETGLTVEDFPAEAGQNDGTLAHAIERSLVPLVHARGFKYVEHAAASGAFQLDWSRLNLEQYLEFSLEGLKAAIERADLVSFDIFDTILTRLSVRPDSVMRSVGERVRHEYPSAIGFFERRKEAETAAREAKDWSGDVSLPEIYRQFQRDGGWTEEIVDAARMLEFESELDACVPRSSIVEAVAHAAHEGKRVIAVSDTYLERSQVDQLLKAAGVLEYLDEVYLSSEYGLRKDRGDMWEFLLTRERAGPGRWLHVGDNEQSDIQAATDRGLSTYHCMNPISLVSLGGLGELTSTEPQHWGNDLLMGPTVARIANDPFPATGRFRPVDIPLPGDVGYAVFGPVMMGFITWIANHPALSDVDHLYFLSREGFLLREAWEKVRIAGATHLPPSTYLYTSRRSSMAAAQGVRFDVESIVEGSGFKGTLSELLSSRLGLSLEPDHPAARVPIELPEDEEMVAELLEQLRDRIGAHGSYELEDLTRYLDVAGLSTSARPAVVDIGYSATIQKHLQTVIGRGLIGFYMGTIAKASQVEGIGGSAFGCFAEGLPGWSTPSTFLRHSLLLEAFLTAPQGQTERVEVRDGKLSYSFRSEHRSVQELTVLEQLHRGALSYFDDILSAFGTVLLDAPIDPNVSLSMVTALATGVIRSPRVAAALVVDDDFCGVPRRSAQVAVPAPLRGP